MVWNLAVKVADYTGELTDLIRRYSEDFSLMPLGREDVNKYALLVRETHGSYLFMISDRDPDIPTPGYDIIMTVMGADRERVGQLMHDLENRLGIETRSAPQYVEDRMQSLMRLLG
jgi:hypothetical protein